MIVSTILLDIILEYFLVEEKKEKRSHSGISGIDRLTWFFFFEDSRTKNVNMFAFQTESTILELKMILNIN